MSNDEMRACPICGAPAEIGSLLGNPDYRSMADNGLTWFRGKPSVWKNLFPLLSGGEPLGNWEAFEGSSMTGIRCTRCNKLILDL